MIRTRFGSEVEIIKGDINTGFVDVKRKSDGKVFKTYISELRGLAEIGDELLALDFKAKHKTKE